MKKDFSEESFLDGWNPSGYTLYYADVISIMATLKTTDSIQEYPPADSEP
jgi:hypothetical protein